MNIAYVRVSTAVQNEQHQIEALKKYNIEKWFVEKKSGSNTIRPELKNMMDFVREGDTVYIYDLSRLARNTVDLLSIISSFEKKNVSLSSCKESIDTSSATGKLMINVIAAISQFERECMLERQREGIEIAKAAGKYRGRKRKDISDFEYHYQRYLKREINKTQLAAELGISRPTLNRLINEKTENQI